MHDLDVELSFSSDYAATCSYRRMSKYSEINIWPCTTMVARRWDKAFPPDLAVCPWRLQWQQLSSRTATSENKPNEGWDAGDLDLNPNVVPVDPRTLAADDGNGGGMEELMATSILDGMPVTSTSILDGMPVTSTSIPVWFPSVAARMKLSARSHGGGIMQIQC
ncbi:unnamed protein product [Urochloa humidicola]